MLLLEQSYNPKTIPGLTCFCSNYNKRKAAYTCNETLKLNFKCLFYKRIDLSFSLLGRIWN